MASRKPDYWVGALDKARDVHQPKVGAAWINADGTIAITLDPFMQLSGGPELLVTLFPNKDKGTPAKEGEQKSATLSPRQLGYDEEVPF